MTHAAKIHARDKIHSIVGDLVNRHPNIVRELIDCLAGHLVEQEINREKAQKNWQDATRYLEALTRSERELVETREKLKAATDELTRVGA